ncbi:OpgC domain-containing protein [Fibrobacter sp. UWEL]|uniref:OpgC domain-containing protein n=1 Tax=Fibrobacter sp. UWEL TaxID=1896209 RepID=UPI00091DE86C|nr:OpgC domain-containing protein [Fibrobacter sp. UWEL]SHK60297.1 hypothetical protein SAMN05720468_10420 [Fibrobacter sp. UWEL]
MRIRALDSIRGLLLLQMTLDHFGKPISQYLYQCFGFFSAAEGFFFLSGFVGMYAATSKQAKDPTQSWMRKRALRIWIYHLSTLVLMGTLGFFLLPRIRYLFQPIYNHPLEAIPLSLSLVHTPEWMDILPLYVILMLVGSLLFPFFTRAKNKWQVFLLWLPSLGLWLASQFGIRDTVNGIFPSWTHHGVFDPFSWQLVYFTGAAVAAWWKRTDESSTRVIGKLTLPLVFAFTFCLLWSRGALPLPTPGEALTSREHLGALRFADFFTFMMLIGAIVRKWPAALDFKFTNVIGKHSLDVYSSHIVFLLLWFSTPGSIRYSAPWNVIAPVVTCILLWVIAKLREPKH